MILMLTYVHIQSSTKVFASYLGELLQYTWLQICPQHSHIEEGHLAGIFFLFEKKCRNNESRSR